MKMKKMKRGKAPSAAGANKLARRIQNTSKAFSRKAMRAKL